MTSNDVFLLFFDALQHCSSEVLKLSDDELEDSILEDLDIETTEFYPPTLDYLVNERFITPEICAEVTLLRIKINNVIGVHEKRNARAFRSDPEWLEIYSLSDKIIKQLL